MSYSKKKCCAISLLARFRCLLFAIAYIVSLVQAEEPFEVKHSDSQTVADSTINFPLSDYPDSVVRQRSKRFMDSISQTKEFIQSQCRIDSILKIPNYLPTNLLLQLPDNKCLVEKDGCIIDARLFNAYCRFFTGAVRANSLKEAQQTILDQILEIYFWNERGNQGVDTIDAYADKMSQEQAENKDIISLPDPLGISPEYYSVYRKNFAFFRSKTNEYADIIGASDSGVLNLIIEKIASASNSGHFYIQFDKRDPGVLGGCDDGFLWYRQKIGDLPKQIKPAIDSIPKGKEISRIIKTSCGYFIAKRAGFQKIPEMPFDSVPQKLLNAFIFIQHATKEQVDKVYAYYREHLAEFMPFDTLLIRSHIVPALCKVEDGKIDSIRASQILRADSAFVISDTILSSYALPAPLSKALSKIGTTVSLDSAYGPLSTECGYWYFKVKGIKKSASPIPFAQVKDSLLQIMFSGNSKIAAYKDPLREFIRNFYRAIAIKDAYFNRMQSKKDTADPPPDDQARYQEANEAFQHEFLLWKSGLSGYL